MPSPQSTYVSSLGPTSTGVQETPFAGFLDGKATKRRSHNHMCSTRVSLGVVVAVGLNALDPAGQKIYRGAVAEAVCTSPWLESPPTRFDKMLFTLRYEYFRSVERLPYNCSTAGSLFTHFPLVLRTYMGLARRAPNVMSKNITHIRYFHFYCTVG